MESNNKKIPETLFYQYNLPGLDAFIAEDGTRNSTSLEQVLGVIAQIGHPVILCDKDWRIIDYSLGVEILFGDDSQIRKGMRLPKTLTLPFTNNECDPPKIGVVQEALIDRYVLPSGRHCALKVSCSLIHSDAGMMHRLFFMTDVSELVQAQQAALSANVAKSQFLAHISHEIRTPLLGILGFCERLGRVVMDENQQESVETIESCANQLLGLVNNLLDLSKIESKRVDLNKHSFNMKVLIKQMLLLIQPSLNGKNLTLEVDIDSTLPENLVGDELKIRQVLSNLLVNAIKYTDSGSIRVAVQRKIGPVQNSRNCSVCITVADSGIGVSGSERERIFEPFVQVDRIRKDHGNGLGLAICRQLVDLMGGSIWCEPNQPCGSLFSFVLPLELVRSNDEVSEKKGNYSVPASQVKLTSQPTVLLVEDIKVNRKLIQYMLEDLGCSVITADNGERCLALLEKVVPDLILMDMQMPVLNGFDATKSIRQSQQLLHIPIVALTAYAMSGDVEKCMEVGCNHYLSKPFTREQLYTILERCLGSSINYSEIS